jgi:hypothetical protein
MGKTCAKHIFEKKPHKPMRKDLVMRCLEFETDHIPYEQGGKVIAKCMELKDMFPIFPRERCKFLPLIKMK